MGATDKSPRPDSLGMADAGLQRTLKVEPVHVEIRWRAPPPDRMSLKSHCMERSIVMKWDRTCCTVHCAPSS